MTPGGKSGIAQWARSHWAVLRRVLTAGFIVLVVLLLGIAASHVEWDKVLAAMARTPMTSLLLAAGLTLVSYLVYACFDLLGKWYTGHDLSTLRTMVIACISYAFTMSLGSSVGGLGLRLRLYTKSGVSPGNATRIFGLAVTSNWAGYGLIAGLVFAAGVVTLPSGWHVGSAALRGLGVGLVALALIYVASCFVSRKRKWSLRGHEIELPSGQMALAQVALAALNWSLMGGILYLLLPDGPGYVLVLGVVLLSAIAGLIARLPAGLGVLEAMTVALLSSPDLPRSAVLASTLVYRAVYYLAPLFIAGIWYLLMEVRLKKQGQA